MNDRNERNFPLKDSSSFASNSNFSDQALKDTRSFSVSYTKTNKLIAALYMVTDIINSTEPLRSKLRTLGAEIISDMSSIQSYERATGPLQNKIKEVVSFLDIASLVGMISEMNYNILRKEFLALQSAIVEAKSTDFYGGHATLSGFLQEQEALPERFTVTAPIKDTRIPIGHVSPTHIGVQKGHDLMKVLSDRIPGMSLNRSVSHGPSKEREKFESLKADRRKEILAIIKDNGGNLTITDIKSKAKGALMSQSEKTLQRELVSMVQSGVLEKTGEKRWSRYSAKMRLI